MELEMKPNPYKQDPYSFQTNPREGWRETAEFIKGQRKAKKKLTSAPFSDRIDALEKQLKDGKNA